MGMPITIDVVDATVTRDDLDRLFAYFISVDHTFSTYKETSEISRLNRGELSAAHASESLKTILALSNQTKKETHGYFDIQRDGISDPSGIVKGWAIQNAAQMLEDWGFRHFYIDAGGDIQVAGNNHGKLWRIGIRNPSIAVKMLKCLPLPIAASQPPALPFADNISIIRITATHRFWILSVSPSLVRIFMRLIVSQLPLLRWEGKGSNFSKSWQALKDI